MMRNCRERNSRSISGKHDGRLKQGSPHIHDRGGRWAGASMRRLGDEVSVSAVAEEPQFEECRSRVG